MTRTTLAASGAALAYLVLLVVHLTHGTFDEHLTTTVDYVNDFAFAAGLVLGAVVLVGLHREAGAPRAATAIGAIGQLLVFSGVAAGLLTGESPEWFAAVGVPGQPAVVRRHDRARGLGAALGSCCPGGRRS